MSSFKHLGWFCYTSVNGPDPAPSLEDVALMEGRINKAAWIQEGAVQCEPHLGLWVRTLEPGALKDQQQSHLGEVSGMLNHASPRYP